MAGYRLLFCYGAIFLVVQLTLYNLLGNLSNRDALLEDLKALNDVAIQNGIVLFLVEPDLLRWVGLNSALYTNNLTYSVSDVVSVAVDTSLLRNKASLIEEVLPALEHLNFQVEVVQGNSLSTPFPDFPVAVLAKRASVAGDSVTFVIRLFHTYEDSSWWFGSLMSDPHLQEKAGLFRSDLSRIVLHEGILSKWRMRPLNLNGFHVPNIWYPTNPLEFISDMTSSRFLRCNQTRAQSFEHLLKQGSQEELARFSHKVKKLLTVVSTVLKELHISYWISSGTCLGYFRHCSIIPHSKDVDIGIFAKDFTEDIIVGLENQHIQLHLWFGELNDSLELSFLDPKQLKLDIFFFYEEDEFMWNGGTQLRTGRKFKYVFPKFELCWTVFLELKVRVPCDTETYIKANYGDSWGVPVVNWDWKKSPFNVRENGVWPKEKWKTVMRVFQHAQ